MPDSTMDLITHEIGWMVVQYLLPPDLHVLEERVNSEAIQTLDAIRATLDDEDLEDFYCLDQIVEIMNNAGLITSRHDFG